MRRILFWLCLPFSLLAQQPVDLLIKNARVVDGTGSPFFYADIAIRGDSVVALGYKLNIPASQTIDAAGLTVTPGFIDTHNHSYPDILTEPTARVSLMQGVTTLIGGPDGSSPLPIKAALEKLSKTPTSVNMAITVGHGTIRQNVLGMDNRPPTPAELDRMKQLARQAMLDGAIGLSTGLFYTPANFAATDEVIAIAKVIAEYGGFHVSHIRDESHHIIEAVKETIRIGEEGGLPTQITHHKVGGKAHIGQSKDTLRLMDEARARGVDATVDQYPYTASWTGLGAALIPQYAFAGGQNALKERLTAPEQRAKIKTEIMRRIEEERGGGDPNNIVLTNCTWDRTLEGKSLAAIVKARGQQPTIANAAELTMEVQGKGGCSAVFHWINEDDIQRILKWPYTMVASDGGITLRHPRSAGTFVRVLERYVRNLHTITFEDAIRKMSGLPAQRCRLYDRGLIRPGMKADLVILNPATVAEKATFLDPMVSATGVRDVIVNGKFAVRNGAITADRPGRPLYGPGTAK